MKRGDPVHNRRSGRSGVVNYAQHAFPDSNGPTYVWVYIRGAKPSVVRWLQSNTVED